MEPRKSSVSSSKDTINEQVFSNHDSAILCVAHHIRVPDRIGVFGVALSSLYPVAGGVGLGVLLFWVGLSTGGNLYVFAFAVSEAYVV